MLQPIEADSLPALGEALLQLERGDTGGPSPGWSGSATDLPPAKGGAEVRLLAGRLAAAAGKPADAERLLQGAASGTHRAPRRRPSWRWRRSCSTSAARRRRSPSWST